MACTLGVQGPHCTNLPVSRCGCVHTPVSERHHNLLFPVNPNRELFLSQPLPLLQPVAVWRSLFWYKGEIKRG